MVVVDGEVDEIDCNNDLVDQDELVQTLIIKVKTFILLYLKKIMYLKAIMVVD